MCSLSVHYLITYLVTHSFSHLHGAIGQSPSWEASRFPASQEIPRILWNPKVHYLIHNSPPPVPILSMSLFRCLIIHIILLTYLLTHSLTSMEQSPWEANRFSDSQEIPEGSLPHSQML
jgi:hypothetical protein